MNHLAEARRELDRANSLLSEKLFASALVAFAVARERFRRAGDHAAAELARAQGDVCRTAMALRRERQATGSE